MSITRPQYYKPGDLITPDWKRAALWSEADVDLGDVQLGQFMTVLSYASLPPFYDFINDTHNDQRLYYKVVVDDGRVGWVFTSTTKRISER